MSRLENLSPIDFEDLCRDIAHAETGLRFSAFGPGPDGGVDGRHSKDANRTVLQCKHYIGSPFSVLKTAVNREIQKLQRLKPNRYMLFTSQSLTPTRADQLATLLDTYLINPGDIWGQEDIEDALRRHPTVEKSHLKLWLSSTAVLQRILQSGLEAYTRATREDILAELKVYARNESFDEAAKKLEEQKILVISGPPGVGKSTLAKMLSYYYLNQDWTFCAIGTLDEGFARIDDEVPTIFFFDDFLGRIKLDQQSLLQRESAFASFVRRVRASKNARFVLTTRAHIFEEARRISDYVDDKHLQLSKYLLDVGSYTRKIRSYILYNHLSVSSLSKEHFGALLEGDWLKRIVDHKNYNPRTIASASSNTLDTMEPADYPGYLFKALENPDLIWSKPFRALDMKSQNLLIALYFGSQFGTPINELRPAFSSLHRGTCAHYGQATMPIDFEDALKTLESGFVSIAGQSVTFVNPSLRDFLRSYLVDRELLLLLPPTVQKSDCGSALWSHVKDLYKQHPDVLQEFALKFLAFSNTMPSAPTLVRNREENRWSFSLYDLPLSGRIELLLEWWDASRCDDFIQMAVTLLNEESLELVSWVDGHTLPKIHWQASNFIDYDHPLNDKLLEGVIDRLIAVIEGGVSINELINIIKSVNEHMEDSVSETLEDAIGGAVHYEFYDTDDAIGHLDSEESLHEHMEYLDNLAQLTGESAESAKETVSLRLGELEEPDYGEHRLDFSKSQGAADEKFSDEAMKSLFWNLLQ